MIDAESTRLNGDCLRVSSTLTVQVLAKIVDASLSASQSAKSFSNVLVAVLISSMYPEMSRPPRSVGNSQDI